MMIEVIFTVLLLLAFIAYYIGMLGPDSGILIFVLILLLAKLFKRGE